MEATMPHAFINICIPMPATQADAVDAVLRSLTKEDGGNQPADTIQRTLYEIGAIHFMTIVVVRPGSPAIPAGNLREGEKAHLVFEISSDFGTAETVHALTASLKLELPRILAAAQANLSGQPLEDFLLRHCVTIGDTWRSEALGQVFTGTPGMTARRIDAEEKLAARIGAMIDSLVGAARWHGKSARQRLELLRDELWSEGDWKWAFVPEPAPCLAGDPRNKWNPGRSLSNPQLLKVAGSIAHKLLWPVYSILGAVVVLVLGLLLAFDDKGWLHSFIGAAFVGSVLFLALVAVAAAAFLRFRRMEEEDPVDDVAPPPQQVEELMRVENYTPAQNHLASVSVLKPGRLRRLALRVAFVVVGTGRFVGAPGFLGRNGVIHFARWMLLPGTNQLLFRSNFDGTWESYVGDFIADAPSGVTAIWSNCLGFPRSQALFGRGATNRDRLVQWARRQQQPALFWYSSNPDLTAERIRLNAAIRQGLASAESEADAADWLALFGSAPRPADSLQIPEIPALVFGGMSRLRYATVHVLRFGEGGRDACRQWLAQASKAASYGEMLPGQRSAVVIALSVTGLSRLGVPEDTLDTFPAAFRQGMWNAERARALADTGENAPEHWSWGYGDGDRAADVLMAVYGMTQRDVDDAQQPLLRLAAGLRHTVVHSRRLQDLPEKPAPGAGGGHLPQSGVHEPFGFRDGVSQPIIRGAPRANRQKRPNDMVEAGEMVLGYVDNIGTIPPSPSIAAEHDPLHDLPDAGPDPLRRRPECSRYESNGRRDIGANGTFLVVRELEQDVEKFDKWLEGAVDEIQQHALIAKDGARVAIVWGEAAEEAAARGHLPHASEDNLQPLQPQDRGQIRDAIAAKLIGRWKDGTSLVRYPLMPGTVADPDARPDNAFLFGGEDPAGHACPFGAHIRRANPRDTRFPKDPQEIATVNRHRILRVGRPYGSSETQEKGLMFICVNASIERQFEFVQKTWLLNPNLHGLENEVDPILGRDDKERGSRFLTVPTPTGPVRLKRVPDVVTVRGGGYFFLPGRGAMRFLATHEFQ
jgi:deferrochelatase/peroxidase EfeB